jgi:hypothetical protein
MAGKIDIAVEIGEAALTNPTVRKAAENALGTAARLLEDTMPQSVANVAAKAEGIGHEYLAGFDQAHYKFVPARELATDIRTASNVIMRDTDGPSRIVFGENNAVQHVLFNRNSTDVERADHILTAGYAGLIRNDVLAKEAVGKVIGQSAGFISHPIERFATTEEMQQNAIDGARAYVARDAAGANKFTNYLTERFGAYTEEQQEWGRHILTAAGPESAFSDAFGTATTDLVKAGMPITTANRATAARELASGVPITPETRAAAANPDLRPAPWHRADTIRGMAAYGGDVLKEGGPKGALGTDALAGGIAPKVTAADVARTVAEMKMPSPFDPLAPRVVPFGSATDMSQATAIGSGDPLVSAVGSLIERPVGASLADSRTAWNNLSAARREAATATSVTPESLVSEQKIVDDLATGDYPWNKH